MMMFPSQWALILGIQQRKILTWVMDGELPAEIKNKVIRISSDDLAKFLADHPEHVGRIYCDDLVTSINRDRAELVEQMEAIRDANAHKRSI